MTASWVRGSCLGGILLAAILTPCALATDPRSDRSQDEISRAASEGLKPLTSHFSFKVSGPPVIPTGADGEGLDQTESRQEQENAARMAAAVADEIGVFEAEKLSGQAKIDRLERAARAGEAASAMELGDRLDVGDGLAQDATRAFGYYHAAAIGGRMEAAHNVGVAYAAGRGVPHDLTEALAWLMVARGRGDPSGVDETLRQDLMKQGRVELLAAAERRARELQPKAARAAVIASLPAAKPLVFVAASPDADAAAANEGEAVDTPLPDRPPGIVVMTITGARLTWRTLADLQRDADHGESQALDALGRLLAAGKMMPPDPLRAVVLLERSAALGNIDAAQQLGDLYSGGEKIQRDDAKAFSYYLKAARAGCAVAMASVGIFSTNGRGTARDLANGLAWLIAAQHFGVDLGQERRLRAFLARNDAGAVTKAETTAVGLIHIIEAGQRRPAH